MRNCDSEVVLAKCPHCEYPASAKNAQFKFSVCYIATCVYGSYDCPEVWVLRRHRDENLSKSFFGRVFTRIYYMLAPPTIKMFGKTKWFNSFWKKRLDKKVNKLKSKGVQDTPYFD